MAAVKPFPDAAWCPYIDVLLALNQNWNTASPTYTSIGDKLLFGHGLAWHRGRNDEEGQLEPGGFDLAVRSDAIARSNWQQGTRMQIWTYWPTTSTAYMQFEGFAEDWEATWTPDDYLKGWAPLRISGPEFHGGLAWSEIVSLAFITTTAVGRLQDYAKYAGFPATKTSFAAGSYTLSRQTVAGESVLQASQKVAEGQSQIFYTDRTGLLRTLTQPFSSSSLATFGTAPGELPWFEADEGVNGGYRFTQAVITPDGGTAVTRNATTTRYGIRSYQRSIAAEDQTTAATLATSLTGRFPNMGADRLKAVRLRPAAMPAQMWPVVLAADIGNRYTFNQPVSGTTGYVQSIAHQITTAGWAVTWNTSPS